MGNATKRSKWSMAVCLVLLASTLLGMIVIVPSQVSADGDNGLGNGVITDNFPSSITADGQGFYDGTHYWAFFAEGKNVSYAYSSDTITWSDRAVFWTNIDYGNNMFDGSNFKVAFDGTGVNVLMHFVNQTESKSNFIYEYGSLSGTTITWGDPTYFYSSAASQLIGGDIAIDGDGYPWVAYTCVIGGYYYRLVYESSTKGGDFTVVNHSFTPPLDIQNGYTGYGFIGKLAPYDSGMLYISGYMNGGSTVEHISMRAWNGSSWSAITNITATLPTGGDNQFLGLDVTWNDDQIAVMYGMVDWAVPSFNLSAVLIDNDDLEYNASYDLYGGALAPCNLIGAATDSNGTFYAFYTLYETWDPDEGVGSDQQAYYTVYNGTWSVAIDTGFPYPQGPPCMVNDQGDNILLMYCDNGQNYVNASDTSDWTPFAGGSGPAPGTWTPTITSTPVTSVYQSEAYSYDVNANETSTYYLTTNSTGLAINLNTGVLSGTVDAVGTPYIHVRARSTAGTESVYQNFTLTVAQVKVTSSAVTTLVEMATYSYQVTATRAVDTWHLSTNASFLSISAGGKITGTGAMYANHTYRVNISADMYNSAQLIHQNYTLTMTSVAFAITSTPGTSVDEESTYSYAVTASKTITSLFLRTNASFLSLGTHTVSGLAPSGSAGFYWVNLTVNDTLGAHDSDNFTLTVDELGGGGGGGGSSLVCDGSFTANGLTVTFHDESWTSMGTINSFLWAFGDGTQANTKEATHSYHQSGSYTVTHVVRDTYGREKAQYYEVGVSGPDPSGGNPASISPMTLVVFGAFIGAGSFLFIKGGMKRPLIVIGIAMLAAGLLLGGWVKLW
jgi:hypothetical protein